MKPVKAPALPWLNRHWACPSCGGVVEFEISDAKLKPELMGGRWVMGRRWECCYCRNLVTFAETMEAA